MTENRIPAYEGTKPYIFVSYAHKDSALVMPYMEQLFSLKYRVWYDEGIPPGSEWPKNIAEHLQGADTVLVFVSDHSLASKNCENEVVRAVNADKKIIQFELGRSHESLNHCLSVKDGSQLVSGLDENLIGDGISGYTRSVGKKKGSLWNILLGIAAVLACVLGLMLYQLNQGAFDSYLPGLNASAATAEPTADASEETVQVDDGILGKAIADKVGKDDLMQEVVFSDIQTQNMLLDAIGFQNWDKDTLTYFDLTNLDSEELYFEKINDEVLPLLQYLPNLKKITVRNGQLSNLELMTLCANLKTVCLYPDLFPLDIPQNASFSVEYVS